ncbi:MAG: fibronectin type III domain-containing protein [Bacteroidales bacterium]|jgi:hypothetical protein
MRKLVVVICAALALVSCSKDEDKAETKMGEIQNITFQKRGSEVLFSWEAFDGAYCYQLFVDKVAASELPISSTTFSAGELIEGVEVNVVAYADMEMKKAIAEGYITFTSSSDGDDTGQDDLPKVTSITVEVDDQSGDYTVSWNKNEEATSYNVYVNSKSVAEYVTSIPYMLNKDDMEKHDTLKIDAWDEIEEKVIASGKIIYKEDEPSKVSNLTFTSGDNEVTVSWDEPSGKYTDIIILDNYESRQDVEEHTRVSKGKTSATVTGLNNFERIKLFVYTYNGDSDKYSDVKTIKVHSEDPNSIDLFDTEWETTDGNKKLDFRGASVGDYNEGRVDFHWGSNEKDLLPWSFDYAKNEGEIKNWEWSVGDDSPEYFKMTYTSATGVLTYGDLEFTQVK